MRRKYHWRWVLGRRLKGLPVERTFEERYRSQVLEGPGRLEAGPWTHWFPSCRFCTWTPDDIIRIGSYTSIAAGTVLLCGGAHHMDHLSTYTFSLMTDEDRSTENLAAGSIEIGSDVWIATESLVTGGTKIGHGAVVAARSVVTRDVPPYAMVAGSPARVVRFRFEQPLIDELLTIRWWEWPEDAVREAVPILRTGDIDRLKACAVERGLLLEPRSDPHWARGDTA